MDGLKPWNWPTVLSAIQRGLKHLRGVVPSRIGRAGYLSVRCRIAQVFETHKLVPGG